MWVSADLVSRLRLWQGPAGDRREQRGVPQECRGRRPSCLLLSVSTSASELRLQFHKDYYSQQQAHLAKFI